MAEVGRRYNPKEKKPKNTGKRKMDKILNLLIGIVVVLVLIVAGFIVIGGSNDKKSANDKKVANNVKQDNEEKADNIVVKDSKEIEKEKADQAEKAKEESDTQNQTTTEANQDTTNNNVQNNTEDTTGTDSNISSDTTANADYNYEESKTATIESSNDQNIIKVITDSNWKPTKTAQKADSSSHVSSYDKNSVDWKEKITTIATTTGLDENDMIIWYIKNGGSPDTSIGIVSSKDKKKNYRVYLKWVANEGWQPTKLEILKSYKGSY
ncbi:MAG TPA: YrrS family protein [Rummeliibacillus sp.]|nr:YrrS family protein [Rummeliibacillus sp.]